MPALLLFDSTFGNGVELSAPSEFDSSGAWQDVLGTDSSTGHSWPPPIWGIVDGNQARLQLLTGFSVNAGTIGNYIQNQIETVSDPDLPSGVTHALHQAVLQKTKGSVTQDPLVLSPPHDPGDVYISEYLKFSDLSRQLIAGGSANWHLFFEWKTGGQGTNYGGDYRLASYVIKNNDGSLHFHVDGDSVADGGLPKETFWRQDSAVPVPINRWFHFEVFWHRASDGTGHIWEAVNGQTIIDHYGPNMGVNNDPVNRIMLSTPYADVPVQQSVTDIQIWNGMPTSDATPTHTPSPIPAPVPPPTPTPTPRREDAASPRSKSAPGGGDTAPSTA